MAEVVSEDDLDQGIQLELCAPAPPRTRALLVVIDPEHAETSILREALHPQLDIVVHTSIVKGLLAIGGLRPDAVLVPARVQALSTVELVDILHECCGIPVIVGIGEGDGEVAGLVLTAGAVACVARPYRPGELKPLLRSISHGPIAMTQAALEYGLLRLDPDAHRLTVGGLPIEMPLREFQLLHLLMRHAGRVITREQIADLLWPGENVEQSNTITVHVRRIRMRLGDDPDLPVIIETIRGLGYRFSSVGVAALPQRAEANRPSGR